MIVHTSGAIFLIRPAQRRSSLISRKDARDSGSRVRKDVEVRVLSRAPFGTPLSNPAQPRYTAVETGFFYFGPSQARSSLLDKKQVIFPILPPIVHTTVYSVYSLFLSAG